MLDDVVQFTLRYDENVRVTVPLGRRLKFYGYKVCMRQCSYEAVSAFHLFK